MALLWTKLFFFWGNSQRVSEIRSQRGDIKGRAPEAKVSQI